MKSAEEQLSEYLGSNNWFVAPNIAGLMIGFAHAYGAQVKEACLEAVIGSRCSGQDHSADTCARCDMKAIRDLELP